MGSPGAVLEVPYWQLPFQLLQRQADEILSGMAEVVSWDLSDQGSGEGHSERIRLHKYHIVDRELQVIAASGYHAE